jgi:hypothetical protein
MMQRIQCTEYNAYNTFIRIQCMEYNESNTTHRMQCMEFSALNTVHGIQCMEAGNQAFWNHYENLPTDINFNKK